MAFFYKLVADYKFIYLQQMRPVNIFNRFVSSNFIATPKCLTEVNASKLSSSSLSRNHSPSDPKGLKLVWELLKMFRNVTDKVQLWGTTKAFSRKFRL